VILRGSICFDRHQEQKIDHFESYIAPVDCLTAQIREDGCKTILIAPAWSRQSWFPDLLLLSCAKPLRLPLRGDLLSQFKGKKLHQGLEKLSKRYRKNSANFWTVILRGSICFDRHQEQKIDHFESYIAPVDSLTWPRQSWFPDLLLLSCAKPLRLPLRGDLLSQFKGKKLDHPLAQAFWSGIGETNVSSL
jgi:hypothetical protein